MQQRKDGTVRRAIVVGGLIVAVAAAGIWVAQRNDGSAVLGTKVMRCKTADGTVVSGGGRLTAENAPLTVTVSGGRVTAVLAPSFKFEPGSLPDPQWASFTIGRPEASDGKLIAEVAIQNLTDCPTRLGQGQAVARRGEAASVSSPVSFGASDSVVMSPGQRVAGRFAVSLAGDGTYEISVSTQAEIGLVR